MNEIEITEEYLNKLLGPRDFFTPIQLVKLGLYGCKSSVWRAVHLGEIECVQVSDRRYVILKESIIKMVLDRKYHGKDSNLK